MISYFKILLFTSILTVCFSCATSPLGRNQLTLMPDSQMNQMGAQSFEEMKKATPAETNSKTIAYVRCVATAITKAAEGQTDNHEWEIVVFKDSQVNAFALPGGKIGVYTGILPVAKTPAQLAAVLGHEVGHVIAKHGNERVSQGMLAQGGLVAADLLTGSADPTKKQLLMAGLGLGAQFGVLLPFSRIQESEADLIGLKLMSQAGFDPNESVQLWKNMQAASGGKAPSEWMSTHPSDERRISALEAHLSENLPLYESAKASGLNPQCSR